MTEGERGFLLLTCKLGDPYRKTLTVAQFRQLAQRVRERKAPKEDRNMIPEDLLQLGYGQDMAMRILKLLSQKEMLAGYLAEGERRGCYPLARNSRRYPDRLRQVLGEDAPVSLWLKGDEALLNTPMISVVGSRALLEENRRFARTVGRLAAEQGYTLVSGDARGADTEAQDACLQHGGRVISVVPDALQKYQSKKNVLYISEHGFDYDFTSSRALSRNHVIHALGSKVYVAQCGLGRGGTWNGTYTNLICKRTPVVCFADGSEAVARLVRLGATTADCNIRSL